MEALTYSQLLTARLTYPQPREYYPGLMRIEKYFLMTDYSFWEVILNGNKVLKRTVRETEQEYEPTTAEEKQHIRNEMKARGTLFMALPNKDQPKIKNRQAKFDKMWLLCLQQHEHTQDEAYNTTYGISAAHTQSNPTSGDNLSDAVICAFLASQPNSPQMQLDVNGKRVEFDRLKVECYNYHKYGHFARECRLLRNQEKREKKNNRRTVTVETPNENALVTQDGFGGYDWSYQAKEEHPINFALMAHTSSVSSSSSNFEVDSCSKSYVKAYATLKEQYGNLNSEYNKFQFNLVSYKAGLESAEARQAHYKSEKKGKEKIVNFFYYAPCVLEFDDVIDKFKTGLGYNATSSTAASPAVESFVNSSEMLENQECNKSKSDKGYHTVPPPYTGNFIPFKPALMFMDEIVKIEPKTVRNQ
ncbi:ribonuclease H-like domain-containing protein [Tanacetum coccineum]